MTSDTSKRVAETSTMLLDEFKELKSVVVAQHKQMGRKIERVDSSVMSLSLDVRGITEKLSFHDDRIKKLEGKEPFIPNRKEVKSITHGAISEHRIDCADKSSVKGGNKPDSIAPRPPKTETIVWSVIGRVVVPIAIGLLGVLFTLLFTK